jgi:hypothetical protein
MIIRRRAPVLGSRLLIAVVRSCRDFCRIPSAVATVILMRGERLPWLAAALLFN